MKVSRYAGRLKLFVNNWKNICEDNWVLGVVRGYRIEFVSCPVQCFEPRPLQRDLKVDKCISRLLDIGAIEEVDEAEGQFVSPIFTVPKHDGSDRLILNLKKLNEFVSTEHFKLEDSRTVVNIMRKDMYMATLDLRDAYHLISIHPESRKYLRFRYDGKLYQYSVLPFGLSVAPLVFTKLLKPLVSTLRAAGYRSVVYLDDIWLAGLPLEECNNNIYATVKLFTDVGFLLNEDRSVLRPQQCVKYLGFMFNSVAMSISLPDDK